MSFLHLLLLGVTCTLAAGQTCNQPGLTSCLLKFMSSVPFEASDPCVAAHQQQDCYENAGCMSRFTLCANSKYADCGLCDKQQTVTKTVSFLNVSKIIIYSDGFTRSDAPLYPLPPATANVGDFKFVVKTSQDPSTVVVSTLAGTDGFKTITVSTRAFSSVELQYPQAAQLAILNSGTSGRKTEVMLYPSAAIPNPTASRGGVLLDGMAVTEDTVLCPNLMQGGLIWAQGIEGGAFAIEEWAPGKDYRCLALVYQPTDKSVWGHCAKGPTVLGPNADRMMVKIPLNGDPVVEVWQFSKFSDEMLVKGLFNDFGFDRQGNIYGTITANRPGIFGGIYRFNKDSFNMDPNTPASQKPSPSFVKLVPDWRDNNALGGNRLNGIVLSLDDTKIYAVENNKTKTADIPIRCITEWTMNADKSAVVSKKVIYDWKEGYGGDGITIDTAGIVYASAGKTYALVGSDESLDVPPGIYAVDPKNPGKLAAFYPGPFNYGTAVAFGGPNAETLVMATGGYFMKFKTPQPGTFR